MPLMIAALVAAALQEPRLVTPEVGADGKVTLRVDAPKAQAVKVDSWELKPWLGAASKDLARDGKGIWSLTVGPVEPGIYGVAFDVDGTRGKLHGTVEVPGPKGRPRPDERREVPHGTVATREYEFGGARRRLHVYTPPGYAAETERRYPVLYLLHGTGGDDSGWTSVGRADVIADNLVADGRAERMIIVMTNGDRSYEDYERELLGGVIPLIDSKYRVKPGAEHRAIAGLSNGGGQALWAGLRHTDRIGWIGAFSASTWEMATGVPGAEKNPARMNAALRLLWIRIGDEDHLVGQTRTFVAMLKSTGLKHDYAEIPGGHTFSVWRRNLADFMPLLFKPAGK